MLTTQPHIPVYSQYRAVMVICITDEDETQLYGRSAFLA